MFPIDKDQFKFCQSKGSDIFELNPIKIIGKIESIDPIKKFIDISISEYYFQTNMC